MNLGLTACEGGSCAIKIYDNDPEEFYYQATWKHIWILVVDILLNNHTCLVSKLIGTPVTKCCTVIGHTLYCEMQ